MTNAYPWYDIVNGNECLLQGDFIMECPVVIPLDEITETSAEVEVRVLNYDVVIMSQSCDLVQSKLDLVLVSPIWPLSDFESKNDFFKSKKGKESLRQGNVPGYHLLRKCEIPGYETDYLVVDFRSVYSVPFGSITQLARNRNERRRLLPPYREHLSQSFARFFMRVGLPVDIPQFR